MQYIVLFILAVVTFILRYQYHRRLDVFIDGVTLIIWIVVLGVFSLLFHSRILFIVDIILLIVFMAVKLFSFGIHRLEYFSKTRQLTPQEKEKREKILKGLLFCSIPLAIIILAIIFS